MANINITSLGQINDAGKGTIFKDMHLDLQFGEPAGPTYFTTDATKDSIADYDLQAIRNSLLNIFNTSPGEKILNPIFGSGLLQYLFLPINNDNGTLVGDTVLQNIQSFEPRVRVNNVNVYTDIDNNQYVIDLTITIPALKNSTAQLAGTLSNSGFTFN